MMGRLLGFLLSCAVPAAASAHAEVEVSALDRALERLTAEGRLSGSVVVKEGEEIIYARAFGHADPFTAREFKPETVVDSASLAKPVTAAAILVLTAEGRLDLDASVVTYIAEFPYPSITVRQLLTHSAGLPDYDQLEPLDGKTNAAMLAEMGRERLPMLFTPGSAFAYCNTCYNTLALVVERVTGQQYLDFARDHLALLPSVSIRPLRLVDWSNRAVGYRRGADELRRADSYEGEAFYGSANLSMSALMLADWGSQWWSSLSHLRSAATSPAEIAGGASGLTLGNWYCAPERTRCHYLGHHEGFHHMLYWDAARQVSLAMVTNNSLAPAIQQRLQRALIAFINGEKSNARLELASPLPQRRAAPGTYRTNLGEVLLVQPRAGPTLRLSRKGVTYDVFPIGDHIDYAPGLDAYLACLEDGSLKVLTLYADDTATPAANQ